MLNIVVLIKQVPGSSDVKVDETTGVLIRDGADSKMNPYDLYALEQAIKLKEQYGAEICALSMGPMQAKEVLKEAIWMGADRGVLLSDRRFAGADVLATSKTLYEGIKSLGKVDLILCGKQTTDGDTAQVGAEISEKLAIECVANVLEINDYQEKSFVVKTQTEDYIEILRVKLPCLITIEKDANTPRLPSCKRKYRMESPKIDVISLDDFSDRDVNHYGLSGSPTKVERIFPPQGKQERVIWDGAEDEQAEQLFQLLMDKKL